MKLSPNESPRHGSRPEPSASGQRWGESGGCYTVFYLIENNTSALTSFFGEAIWLTKKESLSITFVMLSYINYPPIFYPNPHHITI